MKPLLFFYIPGCPYCRKARKFIAELLLAHPEYADIPIHEIDEVAQAAKADLYDYYYVPCFFLEGRNIFEGDPQKKDIAAVFEAAYRA